MAAPTPCDRWDLRALLEHMDDSLMSLHEAGAVRRVWLDVAERSDADLVDSIRHKACRLLAEWSADWESLMSGAGSADVLVEGRPLTTPVLTSAGALEVAVHGWDVAVACGAERPLPDALATDLLRVAPVLVTPFDRPGRFAPARETQPADSASDRVLAFLGRRSR
jgi:uncharacterized protein (TIGR03086 family)